MKATGLPPFIHIHAGINDISLKVDELPASIVQKMELTLERNGAAAGNITRQSLNDAIRDVHLTIFSRFQY
jgi:hypothetical protein